MNDVSARELLECFHRYLNSDTRSEQEIAPGVFEFCGVQGREGSSIVDVARGTFRHSAPGDEYEVLTGELVSIDDEVICPRGPTPGGYRCMLHSPAAISEALMVKVGTPGNE